MSSRGAARKNRYQVAGTNETERSKSTLPGASDRIPGPKWHNRKPTQRARTKCQGKDARRKDARRKDARRKDASGQSAMLLGDSVAQLVRCDHGGDRRRETRTSTRERFGHRRGFLQHLAPIVMRLHSVESVFVVEVGGDEERESRSKRAHS